MPGLQPSIRVGDQRLEDQVAGGRAHGRADVADGAGEGLAGEGVDLEVDLLTLLDRGDVGLGDVSSRRSGSRSTRCTTLESARTYSPALDVALGDQAGEGRAHGGVAHHLQRLLGTRRGGVGGLLGGLADGHHPVVLLLRDGPLLEEPREALAVVLRELLLLAGGLEVGLGLDGGQRGETRVELGDGGALADQAAALDHGLQDAAVGVGGEVGFLEGLERAGEEHGLGHLPLGDDHRVDVDRLGLGHGGRGGRFGTFAGGPDEAGEREQGEAAGHRHGAGSGSRGWPAASRSTARE